MLHRIRLPVEAGERSGTQSQAWEAKIRMPDGRRRSLGGYSVEADAAGTYRKAKNAINPFA